MNRLYLAVLGICYLFGCSSKKIMEDENAKFNDINEEYSQVVQVQSPPEASPPGAVIKPSGPEKSKESVKKSTPQTESLTKKETLTATKKKIVAPREPSIEDSENFVGRRPLVDPFRENETITYSVNYFNVEAGVATMAVLPFKVVNNRKVYHFKINMKSNSMFSMFYAVDDTSETFVDYETLLPVTYSVNVRESSRIKDVRMYFDRTKNEATYWERLVKKGEDEKKKKKQWEINPFTQNIVSAIFYLRNFTLYQGKKLAFYVSDDGKNYIFHGEVLREEKLKTALGEIDTVVVKLAFEMDDQFKPTGDNLIWLSKDEFKHIVRIESKIKIGTIVAKIKSKN